MDPSAEPEAPRRARGGARSREARRALARRGRSGPRVGVGAAVARPRGGAAGRRGRRGGGARGRLSAVGAAFNKRKAEATEARDRFADARADDRRRARCGPSSCCSTARSAEADAEAALSEDELIELLRSEFDAEEYAAEPDGRDEAKEAGADDTNATGRGRIRHELDDEAGPADAGRDGRGAGEAQGRGRRGERRRRHGQGEDERRPAPARDRDRPRGDRPGGRGAAPGHGPRRRQRGDPRGPGAGREQDGRRRRARRRRRWRARGLLPGM